MTYGIFARVYDELMDDSLFKKWKDFTQHYLPDKNSAILELACGSGDLAVLLKQEGYSITGMDLSEEMLTIAKSKQEEAGVHFPLIQADMRDLSVFSKYDALISYCDSLCYLQSPEDLELVFKEAYQHLKDGGIFLFDVFTTEYIEALDGYSYHDEIPNIIFTWDSYKGDAKHSIEHELSFFRELENGNYERIIEVHKERTYSLDFYIERLKKIGFSNIELTADFNKELTGDNKRWFFKAEK